MYIPKHLRVLLRAFILVSITIIPVLARADEVYLHLNAGTFDPTQEAPQGMSMMSASAMGSRLYSSSAGTHYYIVQCSGPITQEWRQEIEAAGAEPQGYIPDFAYLVRVESQAALSSLSRLPFVRWMGPYLPAYKIADGLLDSDGNADVLVTLNQGQDDSGVRQIMKDSVNGSSMDGSRKILRARVGRDVLLQLAENDAVSYIEPHREVRIFNQVARGIMNVNTVWQDVGLYGAGQVVGVCDTGLDTGDQNTLLADFRGRVIATYGPGRPKTGEWNDPDGHGTHVAGSLVGSGALSGSDASHHNYASSFAGVAPEASLVFHSAGDASGDTLPGINEDTLTTIFQQAYDKGVRIHSDSWGIPWSPDEALYYDTLTRKTDIFCWNNKDMVIVYPAGNEGVDSNHDGVVDLGSLVSPSVAKNSICVGASESVVSSGGYSGYPWTVFSGLSNAAYPISSDLISNNSNGMAAFSSRGPTRDGRIKPDVVAPGTNIISCRSQYASNTASDWSWGFFNQYYAYLGGASMSTPLTAGACTLIREYFMEKRNVSNPSSALVKAALINGANDMYPGQYDTGLEIPHRPNAVEGWGRVDVANSIGLVSGRAVTFVDNTTGLFTNGSVTYTYVSGSGLPLRLTLVWTDYQSENISTVNLVNDLDLTVTAPGGSVYLGNGGDHRNNVEGVEIASPSAGTYTVRVSGYNVPYGPQPFALVVSGQLGSIQGKVQNAAGYGVPGTQVTAVVSGGSTTYSGTTDSTGAYSISVPTGMYVVAPSSTGLSFTPSSRTVTAGNDPVTNVSFTVTGTPKVSITAPTSAHYYQTASSSISMSGLYGGSATSITWQNNRAGSGSCSLDSYNQWSKTAIPLQTGINIITVTATDASAHTASAVLRVFYSTASSQVLAAGIASDKSVWYTSNLTGWTRVAGSLVSAVVADFNADGIYDMAGVASNNTVWATTNRTSWAQVPGSYTSIVAGNFDASGHDGLAGVGTDKKVWYTTDLKTWKSIPGYLDSIVAGDFSGTGKSGLVGLAADRTIWYTTNLTGWTNIPGHLSKLAVGDFNGDGVDDVVGIAPDSTVWYTTNLRTWTSIPGFLTTVFVGDCNRDGTVEILGTTSSNKIVRTTDLHTWTTIRGSLAFAQATDLNADGKDDIIGLAGDSTIWYTSDLLNWHQIPGGLSKLSVRRR